MHECTDIQSILLLFLLNIVFGVVIDGNREREGMVKSPKIAPTIFCMSGHILKLNKDGINTFRKNFASKKKLFAYLSIEFF
jgi:hypothetical protein